MLWSRVQASAVLLVVLITKLLLQPSQCKLGYNSRVLHQAASISWDSANVLGLASALHCQNLTGPAVPTDPHTAELLQPHTTILWQNCSLTVDAAVKSTGLPVKLENIVLNIYGDTQQIGKGGSYEVLDFRNKSSTILLGTGARLSLSFLELDNALLGGWAAEGQGPATAAVPFSLLAVALDPGAAATEGTSPTVGVSARPNSSNGSSGSGGGSNSSISKVDGPGLARLALSDSQIYTGCDAVHRMQTAVCKSLADDAFSGGWASVYQTSVSFLSYRDVWVQATDVGIACRPWADAMALMGSLLPGSPTPDCLALNVPLEGSLLLLMRAMQVAGSPAGYAFLNQPLLGRSGLSSVQMSQQGQPYTLHIMGRAAGLGNSMWQMWDGQGTSSVFPVPAPSSVIVTDVAFVNLPGGSARYAPFHLLTALQWQFVMTRTTKAPLPHPLLTLANCTLFVPPDEMAFWDMALTSLTNGSGPWAPPGPAYDSLAALVNTSTLAARPLQWGDPLLGARGSDLGYGPGPSGLSAAASSDPGSSNPRPWLLQRAELAGSNIVYSDVVLRPGWGLQVAAAAEFEASWMTSTNLLSALTLPDGSLGSLANVGLLPARLTPADLVSPTKSNGLPPSTLFMTSATAMMPEDWLPESDGSSSGGGSSSSSAAEWVVPTLRYSARVWGEMFTPSDAFTWDLRRLPGGVLVIAPNASLSFDSIDFVNPGVLGGGSSSSSYSHAPAWLQPLANFTVMMWAFGVDRGQPPQQQGPLPAARLTLSNFRLILPSDELQLIHDLAFATNATTSMPVDPRALQLLRGFMATARPEYRLSSAVKVYLRHLALPGVTMTNVTLEEEGGPRHYTILPLQASILVDQRPPQAASPTPPMMGPGTAGSSLPSPLEGGGAPWPSLPPGPPAQQQGEGEGQPGSPAAGGNTQADGDSQPSSSVLGVAVGCAVGGAALLALAAGLLVWRGRLGRRRRGPGAGVAEPGKVGPSPEQRRANEMVPPHTSLINGSACNSPGIAVATHGTGAASTHGTGAQTSSSTAQVTPAVAAASPSPGPGSGPSPGPATLQSSSLGSMGMLWLPEVPAGYGIGGVERGCSIADVERGQGQGPHRAQSPDRGPLLGPVPPLLLSVADAPASGWDPDGCSDNKRGGRGGSLSIGALHASSLRQMLSSLLLGEAEGHSTAVAATATPPPASPHHAGATAAAATPPEIAPGSVEEEGQQLQSGSATAPDDGSGRNELPCDRQKGSSAGSCTNPMDELQELVGGLALHGNRLVIQKKIGEGGFGAVYKGRWRNLDVAIKTITFYHLELPKGPLEAAPEQSRLLQKAQDAKKRALTEAAVAHSIVHPNVVTTYHYDVAQTTPNTPGGQGLRGLEIVGGQGHQAATQYTLYLVQEFCTASLADVIEKGLITPTEDPGDLEVVLNIVLSIACGMVYVHSRGIIHGDLKPDNVLMRHEVTKVGNGPPQINLAVKVCDFGLCNLLDDGRSHVSGVMHGTPFYVAPEVVHRHQVTKASDVYAMGIIMWQCYTGLQPYILKDERSGPQRNPQFGVFPAHCPPAYQRLALACLHPHPGARPTFVDVFLLTTDLMDQLRGCRSAK